jgi:two-component system, chemotaxis family, sensor kinase CheA
MASKYLDIFLKEAEEQLSSLQRGLLALEEAPGNTPLIHDILRHAHTLKGSARMLGFESISSIAHHMEDFIKEAEDGVRRIDADAIDLLLQGTDALSRITVALARDEECPVDVEKFIDAFTRGESTKEAVKETPVKEEEVLGDTVRARVKTLDSLVNRIGELIINKKRFEDKVSSLKALCLDAVADVPTQQLKEFSRGLEEDVLYLDYLIQELHGEAMALRMLPLKTITDGFQRLVRDLAKEQEKELKLEVAGDSIEVDRVLLDTLKPVFLHLLNNAVDHGIERPEERKAAGKAPQALIRISARHEGSSVRIDIRDDGRGMDSQKIKQVALKRGIIGQEEADLLSAEESLYLTLRPGFSTSEIVTDLSGRGVGMDVVKKNIEKVKGNLLIASEVGRFTEVTLFLPLTLSVVDALMITCGGDHYAIPLTYVQEIVKFNAKDIDSVGGKEIIVVRGVTTPLVPLAKLLGLPENRSAFVAGRLTSVLLRSRDQSIACLVDGITASSEYVVKGLGNQLKNVEYIFGATILGDGNPALILNVPDIFARASGIEAVGYRQALEESARSRIKGKVLVVDDSITTRTIERSILVAHGYRVEIAVSGEDALEKVAGDRFDLVISDVEMPGINGFELTRRLRGIEEYREVPVIVLSSLSRDEDKRKAIDAGAQAYIVKGSFDQGTLLDTVEALIG